LKKKRVVFVAIGFSGKGGSETVYNQVLNHYASRNDLEITLASFNSVPGEVWCDAPIAFENHAVVKKVGQEVSKVRLILSLVAYFSRVKADLVISSSSGTLAMLNLARKLNSQEFKLAAWVHFSLANGVLSARKMNDFLKYTDRFISLSDVNTATLLENGYPENKILTVYNPVVRQERMISASEKTIFISVGRLQFGKETQKNNQELFAALSLLADEDWELQVFGDGEDLVLAKAEVARLGLSEKVIFHGWTSAPFAELERATALVMTSNYEGFPMAAVEAMSYGIPVISSSINGLNELITAENGALYPLHQPEKLADLLKKITDGVVSYNSERVKASIEPFYQENFYAKFDEIFEK
jgi:UDP-D-galactose:(glucosyl)LPS alpha-1,6-D-galactosyltransferase